MKPVSKMQVIAGLILLFLLIVIASLSAIVVAAQPDPAPVRPTVAAQPVRSVQTRTVTVVPAPVRVTVTRHAGLTDDCAQVVTDANALLVLIDKADQDELGINDHIEDYKAALATGDAAALSRFQGILNTRGEAFGEHLNTAMEAASELQSTIKKCKGK